MEAVREAERGAHWTLALHTLRRMTQLELKPKPKVCGLASSKVGFFCLRLAAVTRLLFGVRSSSIALVSTKNNAHEMKGKHEAM